MANNRSADFPLLVSREQAENTLADALRLYVGRGRRYSVKQLSNATGVKDRAIECALLPSGTVDYRPLNLGQLLSLMKFLGEDFANEIMCHTDMVAIPKPEGIDHEDVAGAALDYFTAKQAAHHPESPNGRDISPCEQDELNKRAARLQSVTA